MMIFMSFLMFSALCLLTHGKTQKAHRPDERVVGGRDATIYEFPYMLALYESGYFTGGASIISKTWALTAAHNVMFVNPYKLTLRAGSTFNDEGGSIHQVNNNVFDLRYNSANDDYDIALLRVIKPFVFGAGVAAIQLPPSGQEPAVGTIVTVTGWGRISYGGALPDNLQVVKLPIINRDDCHDAHSGRITDRMICAGNYAGQKDACKGDSGGPAVADGQIIGIVSWGVGCASPRYPGVYTKVSYFIDWIEYQSGVKNSTDKDELRRASRKKSHSRV